ncbi:hypothetical protein [Aromatoleum aromaticum]|nr:hypothetical protein [Aromatoleum aromaticum]
MSKIDARFASVEGRMDSLRDAVAEMRTDLHEMDASIKTWMLGTVLAILGTMLAAIFGIAQIMKPFQQSVASQPAPIIINIPPSQAAPPAPAQ